MTMEQQQLLLFPGSHLPSEYSVSAVYRSWPDGSVGFGAVVRFHGEPIGCWRNGLFQKAINIHRKGGQPDEALT